MTDIWMVFVLGILVGLCGYTLALDVINNTLDWWSLIQAGWLVYAFIIVSRAPVKE